MRKRIKIPEGKMLSQCPTCHSIKIETNNKYPPIAYQKTFAVFEKLPKELCLFCQIKK